jgi:hypothetical protein
MKIAKNQEDLYWGYRSLKFVYESTSIDDPDKRYSTPYRKVVLPVVLLYSVPFAITHYNKGSLGNFRSKYLLGCYGKL